MFQDTNSTIIGSRSFQESQSGKERQGLGNTVGSHFRVSKLIRYVCIII